MNGFEVVFTIFYGIFRIFWEISLIGFDLFMVEVFRGGVCEVFDPFYASLKEIVGISSNRNAGNIIFLGKKYSFLYKFG